VCGRVDTHSDRLERDRSRRIGVLSSGDWNALFSAYRVVKAQLRDTGAVKQLAAADRYFEDTERARNSGSPGALDQRATRARGLVGASTAGA
jgi:hypothetical protein